MILQWYHATFSPPGDESRGLESKVPTDAARATLVGAWFFSDVSKCDRALELVSAPLPSQCCLVKAAPLGFYAVSRSNCGQ